MKKTFEIEISNGIELTVDEIIDALGVAIIPMEDKMNPADIKVTELPPVSNTGDWIESKPTLEDVAKHIEAYIKQNQFPQWNYVQILQILNQLLNEKR